MSVVALFQINHDDLNAVLGGRVDGRGCISRPQVACSPLVICRHWPQAPVSFEIPNFAIGGVAGILSNTRMYVQGLGTISADHALNVQRY